jgi:hypothetical protein
VAEIYVITACALFQLLHIDKEFYGWFTERLGIATVHRRLAIH